MKVGFYFLFVLFLCSCSGGNMSENKNSAEPFIQNKVITSETEISRLSSLVEKNPQNKQLWKSLGNLYFDTNKPGQAIEAYLKYLELAPDNPNVLTDLGVMYRRTKNPLKAIECFDKAIAINPRHQQALFNKGVVLYYDLRDIEGAKLAWSRLVEINPNATIPGGMTIKQLLQSLK